MTSQAVTDASSTTIDVPAIGSNNGFTPVNPKNYWKNAAIVAGLTAAQALTNRYLDNNTFIGPKANTSCASLMSNMVFANMIGKLVKGNWRDVSSYGRQLGVLAGYVASAAALDSLAFALPAPASSQTMPIGQATMIATATAVGYLCKMAAYGVMGKRTYTQTNEVNDASKASTARKAANLAFLSLISAGNAAANQVLGLNSNLGIILNSVYSQSFSKLGKSALWTETSKKRKASAALLYGTVAAAASVLTGAAFPNTGSTFLSSAAHYIGPVGGIAAVGVVTNLLPRAFQKAKKAGEVHVKKVPKMKKQVIDWAKFTGVNLLAAGAHWINGAYCATSKAGSLGIKLFQAGWGYHSFREVMKGATTNASHAKRMALGLVSSFAGEAVSWFYGGTRYSLNVLSVGAGNVAAFAGKWIRNQFLPKQESITPVPVVEVVTTTA